MRKKKTNEAVEVTYEQPKLMDKDGMWSKAGRRSASKEYTSPQKPKKMVHFDHPLFLFDQPPSFPSLRYEPESITTMIETN